MRYVSKLSFEPQILVLHQMLSLLVHVAMQFHLLGQFLNSCMYHCMKSVSEKPSVGQTALASRSLWM